MKTTDTAYLGLGANLGMREWALREATRRLAQTPGLTLVASSQLYETAPVGPPQPNYLNAVLEVRTDLSPEALLEVGLATERQMGRLRSCEGATKWAPRTIDIDLLLFGNRVVQTEGLQVPHPEMMNRAFVLVPLLELAPLLRHPISGQPLAEAASKLVGTQRVTRWKMAA